MKSLLAITLLCFGLIESSFAEPLRFIYPPPESTTDQRHTYYWQLLEAALEATRNTHGDYVCQPYSIPMTFQRAAADLEAGGLHVNVVARATNLDLETRLKPIRLPLDKGLLGYRMFLVMPDIQAKLNKVKTLQELQKFTIGQSTPWTDVKILGAAGFKLELSENYESLFSMLAAGRFDLFSRGAIEILSEWKGHVDRYPGMLIEKNFVLAYPMPRYFFVPRTDEGEKMAARIEEGMRRLVKSGEFERRYAAYKKLVLKDISLAGRKVFRLPNIELSAEAPPLSDKLWWDDLVTELAAPAKRPSVKR